jgi:hypothetical protein
VRLRVAGYRITEVETLVTREDEASLFAPQTMITPDPLFDEVVPVEKRTPSGAMVVAVRNHREIKVYCSRATPRQCRWVQRSTGPTDGEKSLLNERLRPKNICRSRHDEA